MDHSIATHNGTITMENPVTGQHRTVCIRTQPDDDSFRPGARIASLLVGPDNSRDYQGFAFVLKNGQVLVWQRLRGNGVPSVYDKLAVMIQDPARFEGRVNYFFATKCCRCNRKLTTPASIERGTGPVCASRVD